MSLMVKNMCFLLGGHRFKSKFFCKVHRKKFYYIFKISYNPKTLVVGLPLGKPDQQQR
jgi:hypothetical protein